MPSAIQRDDLIVSDEIPEDLTSEISEVRNRLHLASAALLASWPAGRRTSAEEGILSHVDGFLDLMYQLEDPVRAPVSAARFRGAVDRLARDGAHLAILSYQGIISGDIDGSDHVSRVAAVEQAGEILQEVSEDLSAILQEIKTKGANHE